MEKALGGLQARLSNKKFVDNAAPAVVEEVKQQQVRPPPPPPPTPSCPANACVSWPRLVMSRYGILA